MYPQQLNYIHTKTQSKSWKFKAEIYKGSEKAPDWLLH